MSEWIFEIKVKGQTCLDCKEWPECIKHTRELAVWCKNFKERGMKEYLVDRFMDWLEKNVPKHWKINYIDDCGDEPHVNITISLREREK